MSRRRSRGRGAEQVPTAPRLGRLSWQQLREVLASLGPSAGRRWHLGRSSDLAAGSHRAVWPGPAACAPWVLPAHSRDPSPPSPSLSSKSRACKRQANTGPDSTEGPLATLSSPEARPAVLHGLWPWCACGDPGPFQTSSSETPGSAQAPACPFLLPNTFGDGCLPRKSSAPLPEPWSLGRGPRWHCPLLLTEPSAALGLTVHTQGTRCPVPLQLASAWASTIPRGRMAAPRPEVSSKCCLGTVLPGATRARSPGETLSPLGFQLASEPGFSAPGPGTRALP